MAAARALDFSGAFGICGMLIAQLTDFHVTLEGRTAGPVDTRTAFARLMDRTAALVPRPDFLLISGDLAETGADGEYAFVAEGLATLGAPFAVVPGNHDLRAPLRRAFPHATGGETGHLAFARDVGDIRIIGLDTLVEGASHGVLGPDQIHWLRAELDEVGGRPALLVLHHPPFHTGIPAMDAIGLRSGRRELEEELRGRSNILAVLCGHVHRAISGSFAGHTAFIAPSASHQFSLDLEREGAFHVVREPPQIALHRVSGEGLVTYLVPGST